uniref:CRAL-TRIO domain-containing protein n=1 Tax=viral metagenome TaxID=1070528 RepID=A0A6C0E4W4_9ZZZZ
MINIISTTNKSDENCEEEYTQKLNTIFIDNYATFKLNKNIYTPENIFKNSCYIDQDNLIIQYSILKKILNKNTYDITTQIIINNIENILKNHKLITVHISLHKMYLIDLDKHYNYLLYLCELMKKQYPYALNKCFIYQPSFIYTKIYNVIASFFDKETRSKVRLIQ